MKELPHKQILEILNGYKSISNGCAGFSTNERKEIFKQIIKRLKSGGYDVWPLCQALSRNRLDIN